MPARTHRSGAGLRAAPSRVSRYQPHPRCIHRAPRSADLVRARRARAEVEARVAADAVPAIARVLVRARRRRAAHGRGGPWRSAVIAATPGALGLLSQRAHHPSHHSARSADRSSSKTIRTRCGACAWTLRPSRRCAYSRSGCWRPSVTVSSSKSIRRASINFARRRVWPKCAKAHRTPIQAAACWRCSRNR